MTQLYEKNEVGSKFVEVDFSKPDAVKKYVEYFFELIQRHDDWRRTSQPFTAPELLPGQSSIELTALGLLVRLGSLNLWDFSRSFKDGLPFRYDEAIHSLVTSLELDVKTVA